MSFIGQNGGGLELPIIDVTLEAITATINKGDVVCVAPNQKNFGTRADTIFGMAKAPIASSVSITGLALGIAGVALETLRPGDVGRVRLQGYVEANIDSGATLALGLGLVMTTDGTLVATSAADTTPNKVVAFALGSGTGLQRVLFSGVHGFGYTVTTTAS